MKIQNVKGGYDFLPKQQKIRNYINDILRKTFEEYGYLPVETPILCYYDILSGKYDENNDILKEIYKLNDQGNRKLGLRYDLTVPFAKLIALNKNQIKLPFKRYEISKVFRDGPVKVGRDREFTQCDVDVVGLENQMIEAELISLYVNAFNKLKIDIIIKYNSRNLMNGLVLESGIEKKLISKTITIIDKMNKINEEELINYFLEIGLNTKQIKTLLNYFKMNLKTISETFKNTTNTLLIKGITELQELEKYLQQLNLQKYCKFDSTLARGQDYYTGNVFEAYEKNLKLTSSIGGGGRYDRMITDFINDGNTYPAVGISFGLTSIYELLKDQEEETSSIDIFIIPINTPMDSLKLANDLRKLNIKIDIEMENKKLKKSLDYANKEKIKYVIILGEDEIKNNKINLKDMINNKNYEIDLKNLKQIKNILDNN